MNHLLTLPGTAQARLIRNGEISAEELINAHLRRIAEVNPSLNAVVETLEASARDAARTVDRQRASGAALPPLAGVPFSIKDGNFRLSPDQKRIAMDITTFQNGNQGKDVALFDLVRGTQDRLTSDLRLNMVPIFSPRGDRILFVSFRTGRFNPFITSAPNQEKLVRDLRMKDGWPMDWSPDEKSILWKADGGLWIVPVSGSESERPYAYVQSRFNEHDAQFSPDGHWVAYVSSESGRDELYLESFPADAGKRYTVSSQGGTGPAWRRDGKELFFVAGDGRLTAVPVTINGTHVQLGHAESLFPVSPSTIFHRSYEVSKDGQQFLIATPAQAGGAAITIVLNWQAGLKK